ncbi:MAG TPA: hypothetical protein VH328_00205, partial [Burkholderiaceae bacterium]|nr:hypothetical protein [Burkholderiaceae bacterium]
QRADAEVATSEAHWQHVTVKLAGEGFTPRHEWWRSAVFAITLLDAGREAQITHVELTGRTPANLLGNGDFARSMAQWFPVARDDFLPWHIDNVFLEILIEQGVLGLAAYASPFGFAFAALLSASRRDAMLTPFLGASLTGVLLVGFVSSVLDAPRVAFLVILLALLSIQFGETARAAEEISADRAPFPA